MQERTVSQPTRITFACLRRLDNVFGKDHPSRRRVFFGARGRFTGLHSTPCVVESIFENTYHRRVKCPVSVLLDEAPHGLTHAFNVGGSDQPSPLLPSLLRPAMVVNLHPCSLRDHDTGETLCISVTEHPIIVRCGEPRTIYVVYATLRSKCVKRQLQGEAMAAGELPATYRLHAAHCTEIAANTADRPKRGRSPSS
jgi:hypothetical protein